MADATTAKAKWTVMIYMAAGDDAGLDAHAVSDLQEMERAASGQTQRRRPDRPLLASPGQRYRIDGNGAELVVGTSSRRRIQWAVAIARQGRAAARSLNMGSGATLEAFFDWVLEHHQADRYALVLWGHAYGLGFGRITATR